jgi:hypothetical protein
MVVNQDHQVGVVVVLPIPLTTLAVAELALLKHRFVLQVLRNMVEALVGHLLRAPCVAKEVVVALFMEAVVVE